MVSVHVPSIRTIVAVGVVGAAGDPLSPQAPDPSASMTPISATDLIRRTFASVDLLRVVSTAWNPSLLVFILAGLLPARVIRRP